MSSAPKKDRAQQGRQNRDLRERNRAIDFVCKHPIPDMRRNTLLKGLVEFIDANCLCYPGTRLLSFETRISRPTVRKFLNEFAEKGLIDIVDGGNGKPRRMRVHYERTAELYGYASAEPAHMPHWETDEAGNSGFPTSAGNSGFPTSNRKRETRMPEAGNGHGQSGKLMGFPEGKPEVKPEEAAPAARIPVSSAPLPLAGEASSFAAQNTTDAMQDRLSIEEHYPGTAESSRSNSAQPNVTPARRAPTASTSQPTVAVPTRARETINGTTTATADDLIAAFNEHCGEGGECAWPKHRGGTGAILAEFDRLAKLGATPATVHKAVPRAQRMLASGLHVRPLSLQAAMRRLMGNSASQSIDVQTPPPVEDRDFFDAPAQTAGTPVPGNGTRH